MYSKRVIEAVRWIVSANLLAAIVILFRTAFRTTNTTTVALSMLLLVLVLAGNWGLRYAIAAAIAATALFNYFFLPPVGTFTIADTQNWIALFAFLGTAIYASHLASRIREESEEANTRRKESEMLYRLGRQLLQPENVAELLNFIPSSVASAFESPAVTLYIAEGDRIYLSDPKRISSPKIPWNLADELQPYTTERSRSEMIKDLREAMLMPIFRPPEDGFPTAIPLRTGVRPAGALLLESTCLSRETMEAVSGLIAMSIERVQALENSARSEAAKETERLRTALLDSVTHELRTPLTSIKASVTSLLSQPAADESLQHELLTVIDEESDRLNRLIEQAVEMAQLDSNKVQLDLQPTSVAELVNAAAERGRTSAPSRDIRVTVSSSLPPVLVDPAWIQKVLANLIGNAIKYSAVDAPVFLSADRQGDSVAISVADRGAGIDPMEQSMIFDKFYRGQGQRNRISGTGMGLAISRAIVAAHSGTITVTSQLNHGSVFAFTVPIAPGSSPAQTAPRPQTAVS